MQHYGDRLSDDRKRQKFDEIHIAIAQIIALLDNILRFGQSDSDERTIEPELLNLTHFCQNLIIELKTSVGPDHRLRLATTGDCTQAWLDRRLLRFIIENLVFNAIKFSPPNHDINITVKCTAEQVVLSVEDHGIGIPINDQKHLFETFFRASNAAHLPGFGLRLTIVRQSVELHGGSITFESRVGEGTTFLVVLPSIPLEDETDENYSDCG